VVAAVALILALAGGVVAITRDGGNSTATPETVTVPPTTSTTTRPVSTTTPAVVPTTAPVSVQTLQQLAALLGARPGVYGTRSGDLLKKLQQILGKSTTPSAKDAADLIKQINGWVARRELDATVAATATRLLAPYTVTTQPPAKAGKKR
jgi:hypothetical protein